MTPAINILKELEIEHTIHSYSHDENHSSFGIEASEKLGLPAERVFKTLVIKLDIGELAVAILPVDKTLSMKLVAKALSAKKAQMADKLAVQRATGYVLGGVSPLGQKKRLKTVVDTSATEHKTIYISAGKRGLEIELSSQDLVLATQAQLIQITG